ncbi:MAG TPA: bifunctional oligoribonuclease/PAP phosphatase NrnA [Mycobacteriales bacterium]|nr:bifunctional oligoribonuclease/PAP phosphatase NrnA [Mycobacteriales bacterium]
MSAAPTPAVDIAEPVWSAALAAIETAGEVALACHVAPDGDALGSMLALGLALRARGVPVRCGFAGSPQVPATYSYLPGQELLVGEADFPAAPALLVTLDTSSVDRLAALAPTVSRAGEVLVVDHHERGDGFGTIRLVDPHAAATAVVVEELVRRLGVRLDADIATCVYTGLTTDTGSFKYAATTPAVHDLARRLLETGIAHDRVARAIWDTHPYGYVRLLGLACSRARLEPAEVSGLGLVWTWTTAADLREHGIGIDEVEAVIDVVRTTAEAEVAVVVKEDLDGALKVSTRSKGRVDVGAVCAALGGGGHRFAAGFTSPDDLSRTLERLREMLAEVGPLAG